MKKNELSQKELSLEALEWVTKLHHQLKIKFIGKGTIRNYCQEITLLFKFYCTLDILKTLFDFVNNNKNNNNPCVTLSLWGL
jgi:hypothetical protein